jgi:cathepsin D
MIYYVAVLYSKYNHTLSRFEANTGKAHPLATFRGTTDAKRGTGADPLTDAQGELWYGTVSIGTPSVDFTIDFDSCVIL